MPFHSSEARALVEGIVGLRSAARTVKKGRPPDRSVPPPPSPKRRFGHTSAWIRLRLPPPAPTVMLMGSFPPPPSPPLDLLKPEPVSTDARKRIFVFEEPWQGGVLRLKWDADDAERLEAEYRLSERRRPSSEEIRAFWARVKERVGELGPLPVEGADPLP